METIFKGKKQGFTVIYNSVLRDTRLDLKTKGFFAVLQSLPEDWTYTISGLSTVSGVSRNTVYGCLKALEGAGYLLREQQHDEGGKFAATCYVLQDSAPDETPQQNDGADDNSAPCTKKPYTVKPYTEKPYTDFSTLQNKDYSKERKNKRARATREELLACFRETIQGEEILSALDDWLSMREKLGKPMQTLMAVTGATNRLRRFSGDDPEVMLLLIQKAIEREWMSFYPLKPDDLPQAASEDGSPGLGGMRLI